MKNLVYGTNASDPDFGGWDTSGVTNMAWVFLNTSASNQALSEGCVSLSSTEPCLFDGGANPEPSAEVRPRLPAGLRSVYQARSSLAQEQTPHPATPTRTLR